MFIFLLTDETIGECSVDIADTVQICETLLSQLKGNRTRTVSATCLHVVISECHEKTLELPCVLGSLARGTDGRTSCGFAYFGEIAVANIDR